MTTSPRNTKRPGRRKFSGSKSFGRNKFSSSRGRGSSSRGRGPNRGSYKAQKLYYKRKGSVLDIESFINKAVVTTEKIKHFVPEHAFKDFAINSEIKRALEERGYLHPTPIQDKVIPHILRGEDVVGLANTGTGKTAAFLIPLIEKIVNNTTEQMLVLAPTRELAIQIEEEFVLLTKRFKLSSVAVVGGVSIGKQVRKLSSHNHCIIGTPGRVIDLIKRKKLQLSNVRSVVLDEVDRMLDMGFINDVRYIMGFVSKERQTLCFAATTAPPIERLIKDFLIEPITISVKTRDTSKNVEQDIVKIAGRDKIDVLFEYLAQEEYKKTLVFGRTKYGVEKLARKLRVRGVRVESIHGDKSHSQRQKALKKFKIGEVSALIATDVAARGLDIDGVTHVINYEIPETYDDYIHRIGRTGRAENKGKALTFVA